MNARWDPGQYARFSGHRLRPALELLARVPVESPRVVVDLGCGAGNVTRILADRWPSAAVIGVDSSREMLEKARPTNAAPGTNAAADTGTAPAADGAGIALGLRWVEADIAHWEPETAPDVIYSNAALHWVTGHEAMFPRLAGFLAPGGCLAVQMPLSWNAPSHRLMRDILAGGVQHSGQRGVQHSGRGTGPGGMPLGPEWLRRTMAKAPVASADVYHDLLAAPNRTLDIWETEYLQVLEGEDPVLEWVKATGLRPILNALSTPDLETFLTAYRPRLREAYPQRPDGTTLYPFRRLFIVATG